MIIPEKTLDQHIIKAISVRQAISRLQQNVYITDHCWFWIGYRKNGYGHTEFSEVGIYAHQLSFALFHGDVPEGEEVCHFCDTRQCVRPDHLFAGTHLVNVLDAVSKGLNSSPPKTIGIAHYRAKLTWEQVLAIRELAGKGVGQREIANRFSCNKATAWRIGKGLSRRDA